MNEQAQEPAQELAFEVIPATPLGPPPKLRHALTLANLWYVWINRTNLQPNTVDSYQRVAKRFCKFFTTEHFGGMGHKLSPQGMTEWMTYLKSIRVADSTHRPLSAARINKINFITKGFLRWMKKMGYVHYDLADCIPIMLDTKPHESVIITEEEYEKIKAWCAGRAWCQPHLWLIILGYRTGMSLVDCCHLRWQDIHLNTDGPSYMDIYRIKMETRMGERSKCQIPIVPFSDLHIWLMNLKGVTPWKRADGITDYVHQEAPGLYACEFQNFRQDFKNIMKRAGLPPEKTFKCLRNSLVSNLVNSGMNLASVCKISGHHSVEILLRYLKPDRRALQDGLAAAQRYSAATLKQAEYSSGLQPEDAAFL